MLVSVFQRCQQFGDGGNAAAGECGEWGDADCHNAPRRAYEVGGGFSSGDSRASTLVILSFNCGVTCGVASLKSSNSA
jgi:hypothetical protein